MVTYLVPYIVHPGERNLKKRLLLQIQLIKDAAKKLNTLSRMISGILRSSQLWRSSQVCVLTHLSPTSPTHWVSNKLNFSQLYAQIIASTSRSLVGAQKDAISSTRNLPMPKQKNCRTDGFAFKVKWKGGTQRIAFPRT